MIRTGKAVLTVKKKPARVRRADRSGQRSSNPRSRVMQDNARPSLKDCLDYLASDESPHLRRNEDVDYIILRRAHRRKQYVYVEFVDGDGKDEKEWFEGPVPGVLTVRALFEMRDRESRGERREVYGRRKPRKEVDSGVLAGKECECVGSPASSGNERRAAKNTMESVKEKGDSCKNTCEYEIDGSSCSGSQSLLDTRQKLSREISVKKRAKTCPDIHKSKVDEVDSSSSKLRKIETRSTTK